MRQNRRAWRGTRQARASRQPRPVSTLLPVQVLPVQKPSEHLPFFGQTPYGRYHANII